MKVVVTKSLVGTRAEFIDMITARMNEHAAIAAGEGRKRPQKEREAADLVARALEEVISDLEAWQEVPESESGSDDNGAGPEHGVGPAAATGPSLVRNTDGAPARS